MGIHEIVLIVIGLIIYKVLILFPGSYGGGECPHPIEKEPFSTTEYVAIGITFVLLIVLAMRHITILLVGILILVCWISLLFKLGIGKGGDTNVK